MIGTTDRIYQGDLQQVAITQDEIEYLLTVVNLHFEHVITQADIIETYSGVRPLCDDESDQPSAVTRDYTLAMTMLNETVPLLSVFGGKLTTYRKLAESALDELTPFFPELQTAWTEYEPLPGGEYFKSLDGLIRGIQLRIKHIPIEIATRWASSYGTRVWQLLREVYTLEDFGIYFGHGLYQLEVDYLTKMEWAQSVDDILWRRSKLGLKFGKADMTLLDDYLQSVLGHQHSKIA